MKHGSHLTSDERGGRAPAGLVDRRCQTDRHATRPLVDVEPRPTALIKGDKVMVLRVQRRREIPFRVAAHRAAAVATEKGHCLANTDEARTFLKKVRGLSSEVRPVLPIIQATVNGVTHAEVSALARETGGGFNFSELTHLGDDTPPQFHLGEEFFLLVVKKPR